MARASIIDGILLFLAINTMLVGGMLVYRDYSLFMSNPLPNVAQPQVMDTRTMWDVEYPTFSEAVQVLKASCLVRNTDTPGTVNVTVALDIGKLSQSATKSDDFQPGEEKWIDFTFRLPERREGGISCNAMRWD